MSSRRSIDQVTKGLVKLFPSSGPETMDFKDELGSRGATLHTFSSRQKLNSRRNNNVAQRENYIFVIDKEEIFAATQEHEKYGDGRMKLKGLTKFDDCSAYGISDGPHKELVKKEIDKLVDTATRKGPHLFDSMGTLPKKSLADFEDIESILDQIYCNLAILTHDQAQIGIWNTQEGVLQENIECFKSSRELLLSRFGGGDDTVEGAEPLILEPPERNRALYHDLLDYLLASIARLVLRSATSQLWVKYSLAVLALWAVKLKLVAYEPSRYAKLSISNGEDAVDRLAEMHSTKRLVFLKVHVKKENDDGGEDEEKETQHDTLSTSTSIKTFYYETHLLFRAYLRDLLRYSIYSLLDTNNLERGINSASFESCTLVYRTGLESVITAVNQDRFGHVSFSSEPLDMSNLYTGMLLLQTNVQAICSRNREWIESGQYKSNSVAATVKWDWPAKDGNSDESMDRTTFLYSMDDIVSVAVVQAFATLYSASTMTNFIRYVSGGSTTKDPILPFSPPPRPFQAMFHIISEECLRSQKQAKLQHLEDPDVEFVSYSPLRHGIRAGTNLKEMGGTLDAASKAEERARQILTEYKTHKQKMHSWIISEDSITIECQLYVITVISIAVVVVCGSMSVPFVVRNSISGVDPFQFATFAWVIMAFFVVIAKSWYVSEWPWHDFLHGRIVCKSVSDVSDVTGIDTQMILMKLLHGERGNILKSRGPFNGMFTRKSEGIEGLSIDEPVKLSTMLASGFIVLKVRNETGDHLICADIRKGTEMGQPVVNRREKFLAYKDLDTESDKESEDDESARSLEEKNPVSKKAREKGQSGKTFLLREEKFRFKKVIGVYVRDSLFG